MRTSLTCLFLLALALPAVADDTALNDGAYGPEPVGGGINGHESVIRMAREHLEIRVGKARADVVARFDFVNTLKDDTAKQLVGFPDTGAAYAEAARRSKGHAEVFPWEQGDVAGKLEGMQTFVDGQPTASQPSYGFVKADNSAGGYGWKASHDKDAALMAWHAMWVSFPPGKTVVVERRYHTAVGGNVLGQKLFNYVVATGGVWAGTIGELVADVTLVDGLTTKDLAWTDAHAARPSFPARKQWQLRDATHMRLVWRDFEPRTDKRYGYLMVATLPKVDGYGKPIPRRAAP